MTYQNHVVDPTFFYDAIEEFAFNYVIYVLNNTDENLDETGRITYSYTKQTIRGSLQSSGKQLKQSKSGNTIDKGYKFYCKSLYRIDIGDIIEYKGNYYRCNRVDDYDEYGVREASLGMIKLTAYRDLAAYIKYLEGVELV